MPSDEIGICGIAAPLDSVHLRFTAITITYVRMNDVSCFSAFIPMSIAVEAKFCGRPTEVE
ncbi:MAG: hypothetical protein HN356_14495 [Calditrichaeota bacterium]|nr:hypothetical protein [Calditrichota bacterium]